MRPGDGLLPGGKAAVNVPPGIGESVRFPGVTAGQSLLHHVHWGGNPHPQQGNGQAAADSAQGATGGLAKVGGVEYDVMAAGQAFFDEEMANGEHSPVLLSGVLGPGDQELANAVAFQHDAGEFFGQPRCEMGLADSGRPAQGDQDTRGMAVPVGRAMKFQSIPD